MAMKYGNKKTEVDGIKFDSKKEAERYSVLKELEDSGDIDCLELQPEYVVMEPFRHEGKAIRAIKYIADFRYVDEGGAVVEDVKGFRTEVYKIKRKLFLKYIAENLPGVRFIET